MTFLYSAKVPGFIHRLTWLAGLLFRGYIKWFSLAGLPLLIAAVGMQVYTMFLT